MADIAASLAAPQRLEVGKYDFGPRHEIREARVAGADHTPCQPGQQQPEHGVAHRLMQRLVVRRKEGGGDQRHRSPMEGPHEQVPRGNFPALKRLAGHAAILR